MRKLRRREEKKGEQRTRGREREREEAGACRESVVDMPILRADGLGWAAGLLEGFFPGRTVRGRKRGGKGSPRKAETGIKRTAAYSVSVYVSYMGEEGRGTREARCIE